MKNKKRFKRWLKSTQAKQLFSLCRWLHIYISTALFSLLIFFSVTGITLNHASWFASEPATITELKLPAPLIHSLENAAEIPLNAIQQFIEDHTGLSKPKSIDVMPDVGEVTFDYPVPAGYVFITVFLEDHSFEVEHKEGGIFVLLNDLHKGRHSGEVWRWVIDISAMLIIFFSITGAFILLQNAKHRSKGFFTLLCGTLTPVLLYYAFVPQL